MRQSTPAGLDARGTRMWIDMTKSHKLGTTHLVILEEACRLADRLDRLHSLLAGDLSEWLTTTLDATTLTVQVGPALSEARLTTTALRGLITELRQATMHDVVLPPPKQEAGGGVVTDIRSRISAARGAAPES